MRNFEEIKLDKAPIDWVDEKVVKDGQCYEIDFNTLQDLVFIANTRTVLAEHLKNGIFKIPETVGPTGIFKRQTIIEEERYFWYTKAEDVNNDYDIKIMATSQHDVIMNALNLRLSDAFIDSIGKVSARETLEKALSKPVGRDILNRNDLIQLKYPESLRFRMN